MGFARPRKLDNESDLYQYAVGALGRRMRTVAELKRLLRRRVEEETDIGQTLVELVIRRLTARIFRQLMRAGFGAKTIFGILKKWDVEEEVIEELETEIEE